MFEVLWFEFGWIVYDLSVDIIDINNNSSDVSSVIGDGGGGNDVLVLVYGQVVFYEQEDVCVFVVCFEDLIREFVYELSRSLVGIGSEWSYCDVDVIKVLEFGRGFVFEI